MIYSRRDWKDKTTAKLCLRAERDLQLESYFYGAGKAYRLTIAKPQDYRHNPVSHRAMP